MTRDELKQMLLDKLTASPVPLTLKELVKGLPKVKKGQPKWPEQVQEILEAEATMARVFCQPSDKNAALRYWTKDERHHIRERILALAATPMLLTELTGEVAKQFKAEKSYVERLVRDLIGEGRLHEHKPLGKSKKALFGSESPPPPPPPLSLPANAKKVDALAKSVQGLMAKVGVDAETIFAAVREKLGLSAPSVSKTEQENPTEKVLAGSEASSNLEKMILDVIERHGTISLKDLRAMMPEDGRGPVFDRTVLALEDKQKVILSQNYDRSHFSEEERKQYVEEGQYIFTSIAVRR
ncbi:MAG: hypothetical protein SNJ82_03595 [Gemmataceae bacterium]